MANLCRVGFGMVPELADRLLVPTRATEPVMRSMFGAERCGICANGLEAGAFNPEIRHSPSGHEWQRRKQETLASTGAASLLLCVSRLSPEKGVDVLLDALCHLPGCALWLVGDGPARAVLEKTAAARGLPVVFWGYQRGEALAAAYTAADCFVCPSLTETFGQTVNEALASSVRVAIPRVSAFVEAYSEHVDASAMWTPGDLPDMARAIKSELAKGARATPVRVKTWDAACAELLAEYSLAAPCSDAGGLFSRTRKRAVAAYPFFVPFTFVVSVVILLFAKVREVCGGSVRVYIGNVIETTRTKLHPASTKGG
jgi:glycosyltransferase involved in cell wall biosynthesis